MTEKQKFYEVSIYIDGMEYPEIATLEIQADSPKKAREWVLKKMRVSAELL